VRLFATVALSDLAARRKVYPEAMNKPSERPAPGSTCALDDDALGDRIVEWRTLADRATSVEREGDIARLVLPSGPDLVAAAARLCVAETACCATTRFTIEIGSTQVVLTASAQGAPELLETLFPPELRR
jgi:hypothetical protein